MQYDTSTNIQPERPLKCFAKYTDIMYKSNRLGSIPQYMKGNIHKYMSLHFLNSVIISLMYTQNE